MNNQPDPLDQLPSAATGGSASSGTTTCTEQMSQLLRMLCQQTQLLTNAMHELRYIRHTLSWPTCVKCQAIRECIYDCTS